MLMLPFFLKIAPKPVENVKLRIGTWNFVFS
jgi:hypothetical protein